MIQSKCEGDWEIPDSDYHVNDICVTHNNNNLKQEAEFFFTSKGNCSKNLQNDLFSGFLVKSYEDIFKLTFRYVVIWIS